MLTTKGWYLLVLVVGLLALGLLTNTASLTFICLSALVWILAAWLNFAVRLRLILPRLHVTRELRDERGPVESLWAGRSFTVQVVLHNPTGIATPFLWLRDRLPLGLQWIDGPTHDQGIVPRQGTRALTYRVHSSKPGRVRFEGLAVQLSDLQGFFLHTAFIADVRLVRVLPALADARGHIPTVKRHNLLPLQGAHRHRRPGSGSELLDLRDYLPGDPPKMIAWKASARRDRLMTKEFESEVPIRCTFFVDISASVRVGLPGHNALTRLVELVASASQAAASARDLPGLVLFDEDKATYLPPKRGKRQIIDVFHRLAESGGRLPIARQANVAELLPLARGLAEEIYPHLLARDVNRVPFWLSWLWPIPGEQRKKPTTRSLIYLGLFVLILGIPFAGMAIFYAYLGVVLFDFLRLFLGSGLGIAATLAVGLAFGTKALERVALLYRALPLIVAPGKRRHARWRKQLAAILSVRHGLGPGGIALLLEDDEAAACHLQRFLAEHHIPYEPPLYDDAGRYQFASPEKLPVLEKALLQAVGRGRDNELFVILADFLELLDELHPVLGAVKSAVARHHQVLVVCPWPERMPLPPREENKELAPPSNLTAAALLHWATVTRFHRAYRQVRRTFARLGVPVLCAREEDAPRLILDRLERLRVLERGVR